MDLVLLTVTIGALALAIGLAVVGWRLLRHDHAESTARIDHLRAQAAMPDATAPSHLTARSHREDAPSHPRTLAPSHLSEEDWDSALGREDSPPVPSVRLFDTPAVTPAPRRRLVLVGAVAVVMVATAGTAYAVYRPQGLAANRAATDVAGAASAAPLDLLSLKETTDADGTFIVTGLVGNPTTGHAADHVMAVVYLFDREGHYFATGRAGLDVASLAPGDESPFVVKIARGADAARYRVGFRQLDGSLVAHVDKRGEALEGTTTAGSTSKGSGQ